MKKIVKIIAIFIVLAVAVSIGIGVYNKITDSPKGTIEKFETSYNALDIDSMIECFEPSVQSLYNGANKLLGNLTGFDISDMASMLPFFSYIDEDVDLSDFPMIDIEINDIDKTSESTAIVYCDIILSDGTEFQNEEIYTVKIDDTWYIAAR